MNAWKHFGAALVVATALWTTACNGGASPRVATLNAVNSSSSSSDAANADGSSGDKAAFEDALLDYSRCMREHGVDLPDPTFDSNGNGGVAVVNGAPGGGGALPDPSSQQFKDAEAACKSIMDHAQQVAPKPSAEEQAKMRDQALAFSQCMRDKGFDVPDPTFDDKGGLSVHVEGSGSDSSDSGPSTNAGPAGAGPMNDPGFQDAAKACQQQTGGGPNVVAGGPGAGPAGATK